MELVPLLSVEEKAAGAPAERLRKLIARKRSEKRRLEREMQQAKVELAEVRAQGQRELVPLDSEIHDHFRDLLARPWPAADRLRLTSLYLDLMESTISPRPIDGTSADHNDDDGAYDDAGQECPCPRCAARRQAAAEDDGDDGRVHQSRRSECSESLRDLYRELASRYHPDKAPDEETRVENERLMREINGAYESGDLDALAALSRELGFEIAGDGVLEALAAQYEALKAEVRALRGDALGELVVRTRRCAKHGVATPLEQLSEDVRAHAEHLDRLAEIFRRFDRDELTERQLLEALFGDDEGEDEDDDELDILAAMIAALTERAPRGPRQRRSASERRVRRARREDRKRTRSRG
jgi:hypothetical protein